MNAVDAVPGGYDVAVIGGGPAGAAAAWTAARAGWRVALLERGGFPRDTVCGEFVSPQAVALLERMAPGLAVSAPAIGRARFIARSGSGGEFALPAAGRGISRLRLDAALWQSAIDAGADGYTGSAVTAIAPAAAAPPGTHWQLQLGGHGRPGRTLCARHVIVAAGRWWRIPGLDPPPARGSAAGTPRWVGVKARFTGLAPSPAVEMYCFPGGYCGLAPVENGWTNACCLVTADGATGAAALQRTGDFAAWIAARSRHAPLIARLRGAAQATATVVTAPVEPGPRAAALQRALVAGDACGFIDPFSGDGIARALLQGHWAALALGSGTAAYAARVAAASARSFLLAGWLRRLVAAPAAAQSAAVWTLARAPAGPALVRATRFGAADGGRGL